MWFFSHSKKRIEPTHRSCSWGKNIWMFILWGSFSIFKKTGRPCSSESWQVWQYRFLSFKLWDTKSEKKNFGYKWTDKIIYLLKTILTRIEKLRNSDFQQQIEHFYGHRSIFEQKIVPLISTEHFLLTWFFKKVIYEKSLLEK